jgi:Na+/melibiose symporter-like transporter
MVNEENQGLVVGLIQSLSGLCAGLIYPLIGHLSDRSTSKWGRRSPFMFWGTVATVIGFVFCGFGGHYFQMLPFVFGVVVVNMGVAVVSAPFTALIPDLVAPSQYGAASGFMGLQSMLGNAIGAGVLGLVLSSLEAAFGSSFIPLCIILSLLMVGSLFVTLMSVKETRLAPSIDQVAAPIVVVVHGGGEIRQAFVRLLSQFVMMVLAIWRELKGPFVSRDFFWVFWTKFIYICALVSVSNFLVLWIKDVFDAPYVLFGSIVMTKPEAAVSMFLLPLLLGATLASLVAGTKRMVLYLRLTCFVFPFSQASCLIDSAKN